MTSPTVGELTLLDYISLLWIGLNTLVLVSPLIKLLTDAGSYGKLQNAEESERLSEGDHRKDRTLQPTDASPPPPPENKQESMFLHPRFYVRTSVAFTCYYALACLWNGWLLFEADIIWNSGPMHTPLFFVLRWVASKVSPAQGALLAATPVLRAEDRFQVGVLLVQLFLFQLHLMRRLYESLEVANFSKGSKQHALITAVGLVYYFLCSLTPVLDSPLLGSTSGGYMHSASSALYPWAPLAGSAIFAFGFVMQHIQHRILADLRASKPAKAGERDDDQQQQQAQQSAPRRYSIPYGSLFRFVSMPHYLCEMIEYTGLWVLSGFKFSQFLICVWVYSNLSITAVRSHRWYKRQFPNYPSDRYAVIPGIL